MRAIKNTSARLCAKNAGREGDLLAGHYGSCVSFVHRGNTANYRRRWPSSSLIPTQLTMQHVKGCILSSCDKMF